MSVKFTLGGIPGGGGEICSGIYMRRGMCSALYTVKYTVDRDIWRGYVPHYIPEGGYVLHYIRYIYLKGDFSGQSIFYFIYLINLIGQK